MKYIKFDTIDSTNDFLKNYLKSNHPIDFFYVFADEQTKGRGQRLNNWKSECCKNILISYAVRFPLPAQKHFLLNQIVSVAVIDFLEKFNISGLKIKSPNDIMAGYEKLAGILIENTIFKNQIKQSIIGIGINVNQTKFPDLPFATSMKNLTGMDYNRDQLIEELTYQLKLSFSKPEKEIIKQYNSYLYKPKISAVFYTNED